MNNKRRIISPKIAQILIIVVAGIAFILKLHIAMTTYGTNDVLYWEIFINCIKKYGGIGTYHMVWFFNHPPFMIDVLKVMDWISSVTGVFLPFWIRLPAIVADLVNVVLVCKMLKVRTNNIYSGSTMVIMAAAPVSIMVSGFHGNTDPVMICFLLLSLYLIDCQHHTWIAGIAAGMSMNIKIVPLIFMPAIFLYLPDWRKRVEFFSAAAAIVCIGWFPYIFDDPHIIWKRVFGYGGIYGHWGLSRLLQYLPPSFDFIGWIYKTIGKFAVIAVIVAMSFRLNRPQKKTDLFLQCGLTASTFLALTPGFGVQYLAWLVPWVVALGLWPAALYFASSGIFLFLVYTFWSLGFPWFLANSDVVGDWHGIIIYFEIFCWVTVVIMCILFVQRVFFRKINQGEEVFGRHRKKLS